MASRYGLRSKTTLDGNTVERVVAALPVGHRYGLRSKTTLDGNTAERVVAALPEAPRPTPILESISVDIKYGQECHQPNYCAIYLGRTLQGFMKNSVLVRCKNVPVGTTALHFSIRGGGLGSAVIFCFIQDKLVLFPEEMEYEGLIIQALESIYELLGVQ